MTSVSTPSAALSGGFADAPVCAARAFRVLLGVMARPGTIDELSSARPPQGLSAAAGTALLTLADGTTPVALCGAADTADVRDWIAFHIGAPVVAPSQAAFVVGPFAAVMTHAGSLSVGDPAYPDRSATLILELDRLAADGAGLSGPGIRDHVRLSLPKTGPFRQNAQLYPLGFDCFLTSGTAIAGLPRSTRVEDV